MGVISNLITGVAGSTAGNGSFMPGWNRDKTADQYMFDTPMGSNTIPEPTLTKAQKTFSSQAITPNLPKPKTLYFVYFHLNPALEKRIEYKNTFIQTLLDKNGGLDTGGYQTETSLNKSLQSKILSAYQNAAKEQFGSNVMDALKGHLTGKKKSTDTTNKESTNGASDFLDYIPTKDMFNKLSFEISKMVKSYDKPGIASLDTAEFNEYNRKRLIYTGIKYNDVKITFYDVKESPVQQFFIAYLKFICNDFICKDAKTWEKPIDNCHWQNALGYKNGNGSNVNGTYYGNLNSFGLTIDSNFRLIDRISFCEYYMNKLTVYTIENPVVTSINWGSNIMGDFGYNDITVSFKYEGITNDLLIDQDNLTMQNSVASGSLLGKLWDKFTGSGDKNASTSPIELKYMVNHSIQKNVANFMQTRYSSSGSQLVSDITSILKAYMNGDVKFSWNTVKNQALDTMRKYNMAGAANTIAQTEQTIKNYNNKDGEGKAKYLVNMTTDPTSLIGKSTLSTTGSGRGATLF